MIAAGRRTARVARDGQLITVDARTYREGQGGPLPDGRFYIAAPSILVAAVLEWLLRRSGVVIQRLD